MIKEIASRFISPVKCSGSKFGIDFASFEVAVAVAGKIKLIKLSIVPIKIAVIVRFILNSLFVDVRQSASSLSVFLFKVGELKLLCSSTVHPSIHVSGVGREISHLIVRIIEN
ncbi:hypothetical protein DSM107010_57400 [Chroococcidiopsis cubana SAG 39.79]|uniref:Uncharacterized protein n=1 Tax=Chroococcidiopsis cubana SAG 39.79 TaxID=388085 RepID=A0AB37UCH7_9CYAN|nr:hypothetical protein C7B79_13475 [Chroococcidiopsis cubana CCALA 043]RUT04560.1 hypothetical protein DSM107010_57400 [Chroococcidiopsis cubana SAG 39.79]